MFTAAENSTSQFPNTDKNLSESFFFFNKQAFISIWKTSAGNHSIAILCSEQDTNNSIQM